MIVLDTHAWLWWRDEPERLSSVAGEAIDGAPSIAISTISCWEIAMLVLGKRIRLDRDVQAWIRSALAHERIRAVPVDAEVAMQAALLENEGFEPDPADRIIYATARSAGVRLVSADRAIHAFDPARVIW